MSKIMRGAEPKNYVGNSVGVLVLHGFSGTPQSVRPLAEDLAARGYTVSMPLLKGHGRTPEEMEQSSYQEWIKSCVNGLNWLKEHTRNQYVFGLSMGGTLALYLAENYQVSGLILLNACYSRLGMFNMYEDLHQRGIAFAENDGSDIKKPGVKEVAYSKIPVRSGFEFRKLVDIVQLGSSKVDVPVMIFSTVQDHVVNFRSGTDIFTAISSREKYFYTLTESGHVGLLDFDAETIKRITAEFIADQVSHVG
ncbi:alpha/beta fold hydrolase [Sporolactobacillus shoreae]|uniref:Alpha/beta fold hydrolase n=1 Tax=Sporolactobacillus shoreae TaxID=1465501 RepID=A0A4Z0GN80_9BACL|nr:alpha/beta fold hydrolase [Sporolactobacillus shoreae]TGA98330.1 alpha/beta fold hydrolase [Sporolactobacillus shoreae]